MFSFFKKNRLAVSNLEPREPPSTKLGHRIGHASSSQPSQGFTKADADLIESLFKDNVSSCEYEEIPPKSEQSSVSGSVEIGELETVSPTPLHSTDVAVGKKPSSKKSLISLTNRTDRQLCVFDTNAFLNDPHCIYRFGSSDVFVPYRVSYELDRIKNDRNKEPRIQFHARRALAMLSVFRPWKHPDDPAGCSFISPSGALSSNVIYFGTKLSDLPSYYLDCNYADDAILFEVEKFSVGRKSVLFVTADKGLSLKVHALGFAIAVVIRRGASVVRKELPNRNPIDAQLYFDGAVDRSSEILNSEEAGRIEYLESLLGTSLNHRELEPELAMAYHAAAEEGICFAQKILAGLYFLGMGVECDRAAACHWFAQAATQGDIEAIGMLRVLATHGPDG